MNADLLTISEVLGLFRVSEATVKRDRKAGRLPAIREEGGRRAWLYRTGDLDELYADLLTISEVLGLFDVSEATVKRDRKAGRLPAIRQEGGRRAWLYRTGDLDELYANLLTNVFEGTDGPTEEAEPDPETVARIVELELRAEWHAQELARVKAERDQARNDLEHERGELARSQADIVQGRIERGRLEAQAEAVQAIADERQARIEALDAHAQELLERADNTADELRDALNNVTRRYRRKLRQRDTAPTPRWGKAPDDPPLNRWAKGTQRRETTLDLRSDPAETPRWQ